MADLDDLDTMEARTLARQEKRIAALKAELAEAKRYAETLRGALQKALNDSGCDGDLCYYQWHETARKALAGEIK